jgi:hypothetical protein
LYAGIPCGLFPQNESTGNSTWEIKTQAY